METMADSPEVRHLVKLLLLADEQAGTFLESPLLSRTQETPLAAPPHLPGKSRRTVEPCPLSSPH